MVETNKPGPKPLLRSDRIVIYIKRHYIDRLLPKNFSNVVTQATRSTMLPETNVRSFADDAFNDDYLSNDSHEMATPLLFNRSGNTKNDSREKDSSARGNSSCDDTNDKSITSQLSFKFKREWDQTESIPKFYTQENLPKHAMIIGNKPILKDNDFTYTTIYRVQRRTKYIPLEVLLYKLICWCQEEYKKPDNSGIDFYPVHENQLLFVSEVKVQSTGTTRSSYYIPIPYYERDEVILNDIETNGSSVRPTLMEEVEYLFISIQIKYRALRCMSTPVSPPFEAFGSTIECVLRAIEAAIDKGITDIEHVKKHGCVLQNTWELYFPTPFGSKPKTVPELKGEQEIVGPIIFVLGCLIVCVWFLSIIK